MNLLFKTPPPKTQKHPQGDRTGVWENRTKFNQEQARIINDGIYWMENEEWTKHIEQEDNIENKVKSYASKKDIEYHFSSLLISTPGTPRLGEQASASRYRDILIF